MKRTKKILIISLIIAVVSFFSFTANDDFFELSKNLEVFSALYKEINMYYVDETKPGNLIKTAIDAMLKECDPYTVYYPEADMEDYELMTTGSYGGIGALIRKKDDYIMVTDPYEGFPAQKAGLRAGDLIVEVNGESAKGKTTSQISDMLKGTPGTEVQLKIQRRDNSKPLKIKLIREKVQIPTLPYYCVFENNIAYIKLRSFTQDATQEIKKAIAELKKTNEIKGFILDLRSNPGGLLNQAVSVANLFLPKGEVIVKTKSRIKSWESTHKTNEIPIEPNLPLIVFVDRGSASASEIVSGAIQDFDRGIIVGRRTFGKGLVQTTKPLPYNSRLKLTTAKYHIPSGRCIQALDYTNRNEDGSVGKVPDSLITEFKTKNGRIVYDGGGVYPDIDIDQEEYSEIAKEMIVNDIIFDFAIDFRSKVDSITKPIDFAISDSLFDVFVDFANTKELKYTSQTEQQIKKIKKIAERDKYFELIEEEYNKIIKKLENSKSEDILRFKTEICEMLQLQIVSLYYYQKGEIAAALTNDPYIEKAFELFADTLAFNSILNDVKAYNDNKIKRLEKEKELKN